MAFTVTLYMHNSHKLQVSVTLEHLKRYQSVEFYYGCYVRVNTPVSAPEQGTDKRSGVGPQALYHGSPRLLMCVVN